MTTISKKIGINAPVERVFSLVTSPENWPRFVSGLVEVRDLSPDMPSKGGTFTWEYNLMGRRVTGRGEMTEYEKDKRCALLLTGEFPMKENYEFSRTPGGTELKVDVEYGIGPGRTWQDVFGSGKEALDRVNELETGTILEKIKILSEEKTLKS
ncbi:MAG: SRPBCC family protein [Nitrospiraceae bacterium]|nr:SRPBCC family protein [Nitrospiraceae bacterium]